MSATPRDQNDGSLSESGSSGGVELKIVQPRTVIRRESYTAEEKLRVVYFAEMAGNRAAGRKFGTSEGNIRNWRSMKEQLQQMSSTKRALRGKTAQNPKLEKKLGDWIGERQSCGLGLTASLIRQKAVELITMEPELLDQNNFKASNSWFYKFLRRRKLYFRPNVVHKFPDRRYQRHLQKCDEEGASNSFEETTMHFQSESERAEKSQEPQSQVTTQDKRHTVYDSTDVPQNTQNKTYVVRNHHSYIFGNLSHLWKNGKLCDAAIGNGNATVMVHKIVLIALSPKLLELSNTDVVMENIFHVTLPENVRERALLTFAKYMYDGILTLDNVIIGDMEQIARFFSLQELQNLCKQYRRDILPQVSSNHSTITDINPLVTEVDTKFNNQLVTMHQPNVSSGTGDISLQLRRVKQESSDSRKETSNNVSHTSKISSFANDSIESPTESGTDFRILDTQGAALSYWTENMARQKGVSVQKDICSPTDVPGNIEKREPDSLETCIICPTSEQTALDSNSFTYYVIGGWTGCESENKETNNECKFSNPH